MSKMTTMPMYICCLTCKTENKSTLSDLLNIATSCCKCATAIACEDNTAELMLKPSKYWLYLHTV